MARSTDETAVDAVGNPHRVENADAVDPLHPPLETPGGATQERRDEAAARRAENIPAPRVEAELADGIDPQTGEELSRADALREGKPVMVPESHGDSADLIYPRHIQAPPVEQVVEGGLTKANSSTRQRVAAARSTETANT